MGFLAVIWLLWVVYEGCTEKKRGDREYLEYKRKQNEFLGLETQSDSLENTYITKKNHY